MGVSLNEYITVGWFLWKNNSLIYLVTVIKRIPFKGGRVILHELLLPLCTLEQSHGDCLDTQAVLKLLEGLDQGQGHGVSLNLVGVAVGRVKTCVCLGVELSTAVTGSSLQDAFYFTVLAECVCWRAAVMWMVWRSTSRAVWHRLCCRCILKTGIGGMLRSQHLLNLLWSHAVCSRSFPACVKSCPSVQIPQWLHCSAPWCALPSSSILSQISWHYIQCCFHLTARSLANYTCVFSSARIGLLLRSVLQYCTKFLIWESIGYGAREMN